MAVAESVGTVLGRVAGTAVAPLVNRLQLTLIKKGLVQDSDAAGRLTQIRGPHQGTTRTLALLDRLPPGVNDRQITQLADGDVIRSSAQELIAARVAAAGPGHRSRVSERIRSVFHAEFPLAPRPELDRYIAAFIESLDAQCGEIAQQLTAVPVRAGESFSWANAILARATLEAVERHSAALARPDRPSAQQSRRWLDAYRKAFLAHHNCILIPDLSVRRLVPHDELFVGPRIELLPNKPRGSFPFDQVLDRIDRAVLLGDPGAGKSTASTRLGVQWILDRGVSFQVVLREIRGLDAGSGFNLVREIEKVLESRYQIPVLPGMVDDLLLGGSALVVVDGLDEVPTLARRKKAAEVIEAAAHAYPLTRFLVTARSTGYYEARLDPEAFTEFAVQPFTKEQVREYAGNWFQLTDPSSTARPDERLAEFMTSSESVDDLRRNPLLLALICILYRGHRAIPRQRPQIYRKCVEMLVRDWDTSRGVHTNVWETDVYEVALAEIAYLIFSRPQYRAGMTEQQLKRVAAQNMLSEAVADDRQAVQLAADMIALCRGRGWIFTNVDVDDSGQEIYSFAHGSFLEYFAAGHLVRISATATELTENLTPYLLAGRGEILAQIAISLAGAQRQFGGSQVISRLVETARELGSDEGRIVAAFVVNAADMVPLNRDGLSALVRGCVRLTRRLLLDRQLLPVLLDPDFRHADGIPAAVAGALGEIVDEGVPAVQEFLIRHDWAWDLLVQHGIRPLDVISREFDRDTRVTVENLFSGGWHRASGRAPGCTAIWLGAQLAHAGAGPWRDALAVRELRTVAGLIRACATFQPVDAPDLPAREFRDAGPVFNTALARTAGHAGPVLGGMTYLALGVAEILIRRFPPHEHPRGLMGRLIAARTAGDSDALPAGVSALESVDRYFLEGWAEGTKTFFVWREDYLDQPVS